ncbi:MAG: hypothetical protein LBP59_05920, partial [Planctomycetaceae bacterium]|nr:hypothetical protein [Planctomycetaceae bacterium]
PPKRKYYFIRDTGTMTTMFMMYCCSAKCLDLPSLTNTKNIDACLDMNDLSNRFYIAEMQKCEIKEVPIGI